MPPTSENVKVQDPKRETNESLVNEGISDYFNELEEEEELEQTSGLETPESEPLPEPEKEVEAPPEVSEPAAAEATEPTAAEAEPPTPIPEEVKEEVPAPEASEEREEVKEEKAPELALPFQQPETPAREEQEKFAKQREEAYTQAIAEATQLYQLSDSEAEEYEADVRKSLPKLAAAVHVRAAEAAYAAMLQNLPTILNQYLGERDRSNRFWGEFYKQWPKLAGHEAEVSNFAQAYRYTNPNADAATFVKNVGVGASMALGIPPEAAGVKATPPVSEAPATPPPYVPPSTGSKPGQKTRPPKNVFTQFAEELLEEDDF